MQIYRNYTNESTTRMKTKKENTTLMIYEIETGGITPVEMTSKLWQCPFRIPWKGKIKVLLTY